MSARWTTRLPGHEHHLWHRIETSKHTACGERLYDITPSTIRGRTHQRPPVGSRICPTCENVGPNGWVGDAYPIPRPVLDHCWSDKRPEPFIPFQVPTLVILEETAQWYTPEAMARISTYTDDSPAFVFLIPDVTERDE